MDEQIKKEIIDTFVPVVKENIGNTLTTALAIGLTDQLSQIIQAIIMKEQQNVGLPRAGS